MARNTLRTPRVRVVTPHHDSPTARELPATAAELDARLRAALTQANEAGVLAISDLARIEAVIVPIENRIRRAQA